MASVIAKISPSDLTTDSVYDATITGLQYVASYNWLERALPTISVPGAPPTWSPPQVPPRMTPDSGMVYIDQNAARCPQYPLEPLFRALHAQNPDFELGNVDLVTDRNNVRKLLRFVQGSSSESFEIQVEIAGRKTALFTRVESQSKETIRGFRGFGHNFEKAYTKGLAGSTGHHRIVQYDFGGMKCIVRHETDGYVAKKDDLGITKKAPDAADDLSDLLGTVSLSDSSEPTSKKTTVVRTNTRPIDVGSTIEIKTRAASRKLEVSEIAPQLWVSQTPLLVVGYHRYNFFHDVQLRNVEQDVRAWEVANQTSLLKLVFLIKKITKVVEQSGNRRAAVKYDGGTTLKVISGAPRQALPDDLYSLWNAKERRQSDLTQGGSKEVDDAHTILSESASTKRRGD